MDFLEFAHSIIPTLSRGLKSSDILWTKKHVKKFACQFLRIST